MKILRASTVAIPLLASVACGSSLRGPGGTAGTGVNTGQAGASGGTNGVGGVAGGIGGTGIGDPTPLPPPQCVRDLIAACPLAGDCQYSVVGDGHRFCFAGGERVSIERSNGSYENTRRFTEVRGSDGTLCYSIEFDCGSFCEAGSYTWKNGAGAVVARAQFGSASLSVTCESTGETCTTASLPASVARESCITTAVTSPTADVTCTQGACP
jgi:hypothetical protein